MTASDIDCQRHHGHAGIGRQERTQEAHTIRAFKLNLTREVAKCLEVRVVEAPSPSLSKILRKLLYSGVYTCRDYDSRLRRFRGWSFSTLRFVCSRYTNCIRCSSDQVHRCTRRIKSIQFRSIRSVGCSSFSAPPETNVPCAACNITIFDPFAPPSRTVHGPCPKRESGFLGTSSNGWDRAP